MAHCEKMEYIVSFDKRRLIELFRHSNEFQIDQETSWAKTYYLQASDKMFIDVFDNSIILSENGGLGFLSVICKIELIELASEKVKLTVNFKIGNFELIVFEYTSIAIFIIGICLMVVNVATGILLLFISLVIFLLKFNKQDIIKSTLRKIEKILNNKGYHG